MALNSSGAAGEALARLEEAHRQHPADRNISMALVSIPCDNGDFAAALRRARELLTLDPGNAQLQALVSERARKLGGVDSSRSDMARLHEILVMG